MKKFPVIGIVSRFDIDKMLMNMTKINEIGENYVKVVNKYGGIPIGILPVQDVFFTDLTQKAVPKLTAIEKEKLIDVIKLCDGILLPGGSRWYEYEEFICEYAHRHDIPVLGICQGMQIMGYVDRKETDDEAEETKTYRNDTVLDHHAIGVKYAHKVSITPGTKLFEILGATELSVNSRHNYNIGKAKNLKMTAISEDGIVEAIEDPDCKFYLSVQWHPEAMDEYDINQGNIIKEFINSCRN